MTRLRRLVPKDRIFFVTTNLRRGLPKFDSRERDLVCQVVASVRRHRRFRLAGFVVMPDHLHLLVLPASGDTISRLIQEIKYVSGRRVNKLRRRKGALWQKGFFDRFMRTPKEFLETLDYVHQNPVRKGLVAIAHEWQWSSAEAYAGRESIVPVDCLDLPAQTETHLR